MTCQLEEVDIPNDERVSADCVVMIQAISIDGAESDT
jgi:hypothetical protein